MGEAINKERFAAAFMGGMDGAGIKYTAFLTELEKVKGKQYTQTVAAVARITFLDTLNAMNGKNSGSVMVAKEAVQWIVSISGIRDMKPNGLDEFTKYVSELGEILLDGVGAGLMGALEAVKGGKVG